MVESNRLIQSCQEQGIIAERLFGEKEILLEEAGRSEDINSRCKVIEHAVAGIRN